MKLKSAMTKALLIFFTLLLCVIIGIVFYISILLKPVGGQSYTLEVSPGDSLSVLANQLEDKKIIKSAEMLRLIMRRDGTANKVKEGLYDFTGEMNLQQVAAKLAGPARIPVVSVVIPEGRRIRDLPKIFDKAGFNGAEIREALTNTSLISYADGQQPDLEGFIFPATYKFRPKERAAIIVEALVARMKQEITDENIKILRKMNISIREWIILASMVQAEAANDDEMPIIAGVFLNRLKIKDRLRSDPTVAYGLEKDLNQLNRYDGDFTKDTPYNTYTNDGVPIGPINNPGKAALESILMPKLRLNNGELALYFLHGLDGNIHVNATYEEHLNDVAKFR